MNLAIQTITSSGLAPAFSAASAGGDTFANDGNTFLHVKNGAASAITVTIDSVERCSFGFDHDLTVSIPANSDRIIGPFAVKRFNNDTGKVSVTYSAVTTVTAAAFRL